MELVLQTSPQSVLDIGVGFGKYGFLCREYLELWDGREKYNDWQKRIDGIEAFEDYITPIHKLIYSNIYIGDANEVLPTLDMIYDLILIIDVFEHFDFEGGKRLLDQCMEHGRNILISTPRQMGEQEATFGNPYEKHEFQWKMEHFNSYPNTHIIPHPQKLILYMAGCPVKSVHEKV
jgi:hypothetical protein